MAQVGREGQRERGRAGSASVTRHSGDGPMPATAASRVAVRAFLQKCIADDAGLRRWACLVTASHKRAYWGALDAVAAINLLHQRLDICNTEDFLRRKLYLPTRLRPAYPRLPDRLHRVCYLCDCIDGIDGVRWPDTLEHALLACTHPDLVAERQRTRAALVAFAAEPDAARLAAEAGVAVPDFARDTAVLITLQACTAVGAPPAAVQYVFVPAHSTRHRRSRAFAFPRNRA